ncbi:MAG TPA: PD-(D/E)XK nuclease family protein, partial [Roseiflexaceae bacterium]|nr:PD-(D/E)XK nuclease family protein [Roseiflexaceae bacterium]
MTPPAIPMIDLTSAPQRISPTDMSQYIRLDQCRRYLRLRLHERTHGQRFMRAYDVTPQSIPPILSLSGERFEERVEAQATAMIGAAINCAAAAQADEDEFIGEHQNAVVLAHARQLAPGAALLLFQPRLQVTIGAWQLRGTVDILLLRRDLQGSLTALIVDMKSSTAAKVEHRLQVAFYHAMLETLFAAGGIASECIATAILYRGPSADAPAPGPAEQAQLAAQRDAAQAVLGVEDAYLELVDDPEAYRAEVRTLVTDPDSLAAEVANAPFESIGFHLTYKCDGCLYNEFCMKWAAEMDDLSLIPYLADTEKNALRVGGVTTTTALAGLKIFRDEQSTDLVPAPGQEQLVRSLSAHRALGPRLDELVHRARRFRNWKGDDLRALKYIPSKGYGTLPASDATIHPNLVRIYLDVQHDYLHDRLYLLSALVVASEAG